MEMTSLAKFAQLANFTDANCGPLSDTKIWNTCVANIDESLWITALDVTALIFSTSR